MGSADGDDAGVVEAAEELYGVPPGDFTAAREELVRKAKGSGDRELAAALQQLKRPTVAAWAVNLLVREEADLVQQVLDVGEALRDAQEGLEGDALRELGRQRRELIASVVGRARALVGEHGGTLNAQTEQQVAATLHAALADAAAAAAVLTGLLVKPLESTGLGAVEVREHVATTAGRSASKSVAPRRRTAKKDRGGSDEEAQQAELRAQAAERRRLEREANQERIADAEQALEDAERAHQSARERHEAARAHVLHLEARIDELRRQLADLESEAETACEQVETLEQEVTDADSGVEEARGELDDARAALADLQ